jgi:protein-L-isoaspartate(D-aspartate) O-methyltransferase
MRAIGILGCEGPVMDPSELDIVRRAFAKQVMAAAGIDDQRVEAAYAAVRREDFLLRV